MVFVWEVKLIVWIVVLLHGGMVLVWYWQGGGAIVVVLLLWLLVTLRKREKEGEREREREREIVKKEYLNKMVKIKIKFEMLDVL